MSKYRITMEGKVYEMEVELVKEETVPQPAGKSQYKEFKNASKDPTVRVIDPTAERETVKNTGVVTSPMPGTVIEIRKTTGDKVEKGEIVLILEAMKMENEITAPVGGEIAQMSVVSGQTVAGGEFLFEIC